MSEIVFGIHAVEVLLKRKSEAVRKIYVQQDRRDQRLHKLVKLAQSNDVKVVQKSKDDLDSITEERHQGVIAECGDLKQTSYHEKHIPELLDRVDAAGKNAFILILDGVTDPHNLGACLRSADAAGVDMVIAPKDNAASLNATVRKVACGAAEAIPFITVTNLARTMKQIQERGIWIYGAAGEAEQDIYQANLNGAIAIVMGAEGEGMRRLTKETCDHLIKIPMAGEVSSLNVSVATGVTLFEIVRQREI